ncbi:glycosyltransferase family 87 protein [Tundrisphaera lichenicola]|uniref:glycosyltransferase family 87 protein n=1 Tax=Tundrisphaera lichenicola TaxID=2029860 RepID=UPI003EC05751
MSLVTPGIASDPDRHGRRAVWIAALITIIGAGMIYADKAAEDRSAFIRWRHQVLEMMDGANIYDIYYFPNPPIMPLTLYPMMTLPPVEGALVWFGIKAGLAAVSVLLCLRMVRLGDRPIPSWVQAMIVLLSLRPIMSDLHHGNNNIMILFLVVAMLAAWRKGYDVLAGLILAYAIAFKVTPGLFLLYFAYKRSWRTVGATIVGSGLFLLVIPSIFIGPAFNWLCLKTWCYRIIFPYMGNDAVGDQEINQSMVGVLSRMLTESTRQGRYAIKLRVNFVSWDPKLVVGMLKGLSIALIGLLALLCRTRIKRRDDPRLLGEFALVVLTMLFVSERSWKHHFVTLLLPYTYLSYRVGVAGLSPRVRWTLGSALALSAVMIATTSSEMGGLFARNQGHKIAQAYGMFLWAAVVIYAATAWRVWAEGRVDPGELGLDGSHPPTLKGPHQSLARMVRGEWAMSSGAKIREDRSNPLSTS